MKKPYIVEHEAVKFPVKTYACDLSVDACYTRAKVKKVWKRASQSARGQGFKEVEKPSHHLGPFH